jgi:hypothetical protein
VSLSLDRPGALLLAVAALLWIVVGAATFSGARHSGARQWPSQRRFQAWTPARLKPVR